MSLVAQEKDNKCDALRKRCRSLKEELHNSKIATQAAESRVAKSVLFVKQLENKCAAQKKQLDTMREERNLGQTAQGETRNSGNTSASFLNITEYS